MDEGQGFQRHTFTPGPDDEPGRWPGGGPDDGPPPIQVHWHRDADPDAQPAWLVRRLIHQVGKGLLAGQWGTAKTFIALDLSCSTMTGEPFAGRAVCRRGGVLFLAPEGAHEMAVRLKGLAVNKIAGTNAERAARGLGPVVDVNDLPFCWVEEFPRLLDRGSAEALAEVAERVAAAMLERYGLPLALIVFDMVAAGAGFDDENSAAEGSKVMAAMELIGKRVGAFVMGVDHFGKVSETGVRGSSAKESGADVSLAALAERDISGSVSNMRLGVRKVRGARVGFEIPYQLDVVEIGQDEWGETVTTCTVAWRTEEEVVLTTVGAKDRWPNSLKVFRDALARALDEHGIPCWPYDPAHQERGAPLERVRDAFYATYPADGDDEKARAETKRKQFNRTLKTAAGRDLVGSLDLRGVDHLWLKPDPTGTSKPAGQTGHS